MTPVTDPALLAQLNGSSGSPVSPVSPAGPAGQSPVSPVSPPGPTGPAGLTPVTDPDILQQLNAAPPSQGSDIATGAVKGLAQIPGAIVGIPGDLEEAGTWLGNKATSALSSAFGLKQMPANYGVNASGLAPTDSNTVNNLTGANSLPDPQTGWGQAAQVGANTVANPLSYLGPGGALRSVVSALGSRATGYGASALAKYLGAGDDTASAIGLGASLLSPTLAGKGAVMPAVRATEAVAQLKQAGGAGRDAYRDMDFAVRPGVMQTWAQNKIDQYGTTPSNATDPRGFSAPLAPNTHAVLTDIANHEGPATAPDMDAWYTHLNNVEGTTNDVSAAQDAAQTLRRRMSTFTQPQTLVGDPRQASQTFNDAQDNYAAGSRLETVNNNFINAQNKANSQNSGLNGGNMLRGAATSMINPNTNTLMGFNDPEVSALKQMSAGTLGQNTSRYASNMLGGGGGIGAMIAGAILGGHAYGPVGAAGGAAEGLHLGWKLGTMAAGPLVRLGVNASTMNAANRIRAMIAARSPYAAANPGPAFPTPNPTAVGGPALRRVLNAIQGSQQQ